MTEIRKAVPADRPTLLAIQTTSLESGWPELLETAISGPPLVLVSGSRPVGYALAIESTPTYLAELAVAPAHRGTGHGSALLSAVLARSDGCRLTMRADDEGVRRFYERHGFRVMERLPGHYADDDGLVLVYQPDSPSDRS
jgi:ribosomal-protein-alanine N-acetyltransferase